MHICFAIDSMQGGGAELSCLVYIQALLDKGHKIDLVLLEFHGARLSDIPETVTLFTLDHKFKGTGQKLLINARQVHWIKAPKTISSLVRYLRAIKPAASDHVPIRSRYLQWTVAMADYIDKQKPDLIYANLFHAGSASILARRLSDHKVPIVWAARNHSQSVMKVKNLQQYKVLAPHANMIQANLNGVAENERNLIPANSSKFVCVYNSVNPKIDQLATEPLDEFSDLFEDTTSPEICPDSEKRTYVALAVGRLIKQKNFTMLIRAVAKAREKLNIKLVILGEGQRRHLLQSEAKKAGIENCLSMPGWVENPYAYMSRANVFILSSNHEGLPNVLIEALACSCPVVSTDCPHGPREILENGVESHNKLAYFLE